MAGTSSKNRLSMAQPRLVATRRSTLFPSSINQSMISDTSSIVSATHTNNSSMAVRRNVQLENTYKMEPSEDRKFSSYKVSSAIYNVLESYLADCEYEPEKCARLSKDLSALIKSRIREMDFERYKLVCTLSIGQNKGQGLEITSRFIWNTSTDNYATATYKNKDMFAVATVYGLYMD